MRVRVRLLIDLNDEVYNNIVVKNEYTERDVIAMHNALIGAIYVPKGHGDLIDRNNLLERLQEWNTNDALDIAHYNFTFHRIIESPTIIEKDEEVSGEEGKMILKVPKGQDPYNVIGQYIQDHITIIEDIIATIEIDGVRTNELFMVDMQQEDGYFVWNSDWYEGEQNIALIDFFPVSEAKPERDNGGE